MEGERNVKEKKNKRSLMSHQDSVFNISIIVKKISMI
jgi:hypothetical protein